jgi:antitoxin HigA-1
MSKSSITTDGAPTPNRVTTHPGEVLGEEFLKPLGLSVNALAIALRVPATRIGAIVKGERSVTADTALRLARFFCDQPRILGQPPGHARPDQGPPGRRQSDRA